MNLPGHLLVQDIISWNASLAAWSKTNQTNIGISTCILPDKSIKDKHNITGHKKGALAN
jgi:hypothetical protein